MKILSVKYERPYYKTRKPEVQWEFRAETDEKLPHGYPCYAGELRKTAEGWQARVGMCVGRAVGWICGTDYFFYLSINGFPSRHIVQYRFKLSL